AASLIAQPPLIFLDEPTTGLDPRTRGQMWDTIRRLVASGSTVVLTTQYLDEADQLADRIAVIDRGRVVAEGTALELKASVGQASLVLRLQPGSDLDVARATVGRVLDATAIVSPEAARLTVPMSDPDQVTDLLVAFRDAGLHLSEFSVQQPTLDEVFLTLTGSGVPADDTPARESADDLEGVRR
ncbi:MAG: ABC-type multidrug transport system, ATPase component, partial [Microbacterium sp.]|nr:ABC-type multidrug transport system, ATPase component [Microbacterium sp.]